MQKRSAWKSHDSPPASGVKRHEVACQRHADDGLSLLALKHGRRAQRQFCMSAGSRRYVSIQLRRWVLDELEPGEELVTERRMSGKSGSWSCGKTAVDLSALDTCEASSPEASLLRMLLQEFFRSEVGV